MMAQRRSYFLVVLGLAALLAPCSASPTGTLTKVGSEEEAMKAVTDAMDSYSPTKQEIAEGFLEASANTAADGTQQLAVTDSNRLGLSTSYNVCLQGRFDLELVDVTFGLSITLTITDDSVSLQGMVGLGLRLGSGWFSFSISVEGLAGIEAKLPADGSVGTGDKTQLAFFVIEQFAYEKMKGSLLASIIFGQPSPVAYAQRLQSYLDSFDSNHGRAPTKEVHSAFNDMIYNFYAGIADDGKTMKQLGKRAGQRYKSYLSDWKQAVFGGDCCITECPMYGNDMDDAWYMPENPWDDSSDREYSTRYYVKHRLRDYESAWDYIVIEYVTLILLGQAQPYNYHGSYSSISCWDSTLPSIWWNRYNGKSGYQISPDTTQNGVQTAQAYLCLAMQAGILTVKPRDENDWFGGTKNEYRNVQHTIKILFPWLFPPSGLSLDQKMNWYDKVMFNGAAHGGQSGYYSGGEDGAGVWQPAIDARNNALNKGVFSTFMHMAALLSGTPSQIAERVYYYYEKQLKKSPQGCSEECKCGITKVWVAIQVSVGVGKGSGFCAPQTFSVSGAFKWTWKRELDKSEDGSKCLLRQTTDGPKDTVTVQFNINTAGGANFNLQGSWQPAGSSYVKQCTSGGAKQCTCHGLYREKAALGYEAITRVKKIPACSSLSDNEIISGDITGSTWTVTATVMLPVSTDDGSHLKKFFDDAAKSTPLSQVEESLGKSLTSMLGKFTTQLSETGHKDKHGLTKAFGTMFKGLESSFTGLMGVLAESALTEGGKKLLMDGVDSSTDFFSDPASKIARSVMTSMKGDVGLGGDDAKQSVQVGIVAAVSYDTHTEKTNLNLQLQYNDQWKMTVKVPDGGKLSAYYIETMTQTIANVNWDAKDQHSAIRSGLHRSKRHGGKRHGGRGKRHLNGTLLGDDDLYRLTHGSAADAGGDDPLTDESGKKLPKSFAVEHANQTALNQEYHVISGLKIASRPVYKSKDKKWVMHHGLQELGWSIIPYESLHDLKRQYEPTAWDGVKDELNKAEKLAGDAVDAIVKEVDKKEGDKVCQEIPPVHIIADKITPPLPKLVAKTLPVTPWERLFGVIKPMFGREKAVPALFFEWDAEFETWERSKMAISNIKW